METTILSGRALITGCIQDDKLLGEAVSGVLPWHNGKETHLTQILARDSADYHLHSNAKALGQKFSASPPNLRAHIG
eukprot:6184953-Pleurochrysis_carterae.AAC.3